VKSKHPNAMPVIVTHGWPGSIIEQLKIIGPLTDPTAYGGTAEDAFDVVIPSLPGYGFSGKPTSVGWDVPRITKAWDVLMKRLGYSRYVAQGGDWGALIVEVMALQQPQGLLAIHTNMSGTLPEAVRKALPAGPAPAGLSPDEQRSFDQLVNFYSHGLGYAIEMQQRPQTLYGIADSPVGLAGWILDHDIQSYQLIARVFDGAQEGLTRDDILDNITLYWLTNTAISSARLYWEMRNGKGGFFDPRGVTLPTGVSAFRYEIYQAPENWARSAYPHLVFYKAHPVGTHFAAWEQPQLLTEDMRDTFRSVRTS
jgi:pimeloyl-ACP methyl ester carboxylesterase